MSVTRNGPRPAPLPGPSAAALMVIVLVGLLAGPLGSTPAAAATAAAGDSFGRTLLVLDSSGSMAEQAGGGTTKIEAAKTALRSVVADLPAKAVVGLRVFGASVFSRTDPGACSDSQLVVPPAAGDSAALLRAVASYTPYGETPIPYALEQAAGDLGSEGARTIVLVSDGESTCGDPCVVAKRLAQRGVDLHIDVVGLSVAGAARDQLACIADAGNGTYYDATTADQIESQIDTAAQRAARPFVLDGTPIVGGSPSRPTPITVGDWIDTLGPARGERASRTYVFDPTTAGTTVRVSAVTQGESGDDGLQIEILDPHGQRCDLGETLRQVDSRDVIGVQATAADTDTSTAVSSNHHCGDPGRYLITVTRLDGVNRTVRFGIRVAEEPPVTDPGFVATTSSPDVTAPQVTGAPRPVIGGASYLDAGEIGPGRWSSSVVPGEAEMFRLHLDFGQAARISVTFPQAHGALRDDVGLYPPLGAVTTYNPMQAQLSAADATQASGVVGARLRTLLTATPAISRGLVDFGGVRGIEDYSMSGDYYLAVSLMSEDYSDVFPFTIAVQVVGDPRPGPAYDDGATWTVADGASVPSSPVPSSSAPPTSTAPATPAPTGPVASGGNSGRGYHLLGYVALGVVLVGAGVGAGVGLGRRRTG